MHTYCTFASHTVVALAFPAVLLLVSPGRVSAMFVLFRMCRKCFPLLLGAFNASTLEPQWCVFVCMSIWVEDLKKVRVCVCECVELWACMATQACRVLLKMSLSLFTTLSLSLLYLLELFHSFRSSLTVFLFM